MFDFIMMIVSGMAILFVVGLVVILPIVAFIRAIDWLMNVSFVTPTPEVQYVVIQDYTSQQPVVSCVLDASGTPVKGISC